VAKKKVEAYHKAARITSVAGSPRKVFIIRGKELVKEAYDHIIGGEISIKVHRIKVVLKD
jgi:hypothetical protein